MHMHGFVCNVKIHRFSLLLIDIGFMDLSSVHGNKLQMRFLHHYKSVDVRVQIKEMFLFFSYFDEKVPIFSYFSAFSFLFSYFLQVIWHLIPWNGDRHQFRHDSIHGGHACNNFS